MTRQPIGVDIKTQSEISTEQDRIIKSIYGAIKGNPHAQGVLIEATKRESLKQTPDELNRMIDRMTPDELRYNLKWMAERMGKIATRDEIIHLIQEVDATNTAHRRPHQILTQMEMEGMSFNEIVEYVALGKLPDRMTNIGNRATDEDIQKLEELIREDTRTTPNGLIPLSVIQMELSRRGVDLDTVQDFIKIVKEYQQYDPDQDIVYNRPESPEYKLTIPPIKKGGETPQATEDKPQGDGQPKDGNQNPVNRTESAQDGTNGNQTEEYTDQSNDDGQDYPGLTIF